MNPVNINSSASRHTNRLAEPIVAVNGTLGAGISPFDRGFNYGDGLFETVSLRVSSSACIDQPETFLPLWGLHRQRLLLDAKRLQIDLSSDRLDAAVAQILQQAQVQDVCRGLLKIIVTRGVGGRGYAAPSDLLATLCIGLYPPVKDSPKNVLEGIFLQLCRQRLSRSPALAGIKHLNKLEHILARTELSVLDSDRKINEEASRICAEGLLLDEQGFVIEATFSNLFIVQDGVLLTPRLDQCGVAGVMRQLVLEVLAPKLNLEVIVEVMSLEQLLKADEVFLCNSVYGFWPVRHLYNPAVGIEGAARAAQVRWPIGEKVVSLQQQLAHYLSSSKCER